MMIHFFGDNTILRSQNIKFYQGYHYLANQTDDGYIIGDRNKPYSKEKFTTIPKGDVFLGSLQKLVRVLPIDKNFILMSEDTFYNNQRRIKTLGNLTKELLHSENHPDHAVISIAELNGYVSKIEQLQSENQLLKNEINSKNTNTLVGENEELSNKITQLENQLRKIEEDENTNIDNTFVFSINSKLKQIVKLINFDNSIDFDDYTDDSVETTYYLLNIFVGLKDKFLQTKDSSSESIESADILATKKTFTHPSKISVDIVRSKLE